MRLNKNLSFEEFNAIKPSEYVKMLGVGINVNWANFPKLMQYYDRKVVEDFKRMGFKHVRIRVKHDATEDFLKFLDKVINDCLSVGLIPIIAYHPKYLMENPTEENIEKVVQWWDIVAKRYKDYPPQLAFDIILEVQGELNKRPDLLNKLYEKVVATIRKTNPTRIIFISPRYFNDPDYLWELKIPSKADGYLMVEWHFYAAGPSKTNPKKLWTTGTPYEKGLIIRKIMTVLEWQNKTGIYTWCGAWMPSNYNKGNDYTIPEQVKFANFVSYQLMKAGIPFAINADHQFYDFTKKQWIEERLPVLEAILHPKSED